MPSLSEMQTAFACLVLNEPCEAGVPRIKGPLSAAAVVQLHSANVRAALTQALRLTFPTVESLVGPEFFDHMAGAYIGGHPPTSIRLDAYGEDFAPFVAGFEPAAALAYLADVATLDRAVAEAVRGRPPAPVRRFTLDSQVAIEICGDLQLLRLSHPADEIRAAIDERDLDALAAVGMTPVERWLAVWPSPRGATVHRLGAQSGHFLNALLEGQTADAAFAAAQGQEPQALVTDIEQHIFKAAFTSIIVVSET